MPFFKLLEWEAYDSLEPFGGDRGDWNAAMMAATFANIMVATRGGKKRFKVSDFLLDFDPKDAKEGKEGTNTPAPATSVEQMKMAARMFVALANAEQKRKQQNHKKRKR